jgi:tRNA/rRNA methyltransferase
MQDFGFPHLRVVNDFAPPFEAAQIEAAQLEAKSAVAAQQVMAAARRFDTLAAAIADCTLVVGTTAIGDRGLTQPVLPLQLAAPRILATLAAGPSGPYALNPKPSPSVALLFGSEKTGLTSDQLSHCSLLTTIPMYAPSDAATGKPARHLSMNLGQSVAVCLYELTREGLEGAREIPTLHEAPATAADRERLTQLLLDVLHATGYTRRFPGNVTDPLIRQLALQLGVTHREAMTWMGILRQVLWREKTGAHENP